MVYICELCAYNVGSSGSCSHPVCSAARYAFMSTSVALLLTAL